MKRKDTTPLGSLLRQHRAARGFTQEVLAERAGIGVRTIKGMEQGERHRPRADTISRLITALELSSDQGAVLRKAIHGDAGRAISCPSTQSMITLGDAAALTPLIGREEVVQGALAQLADGTTRLLTLVGPPGVGKTRVGLEVARRVADAPERCSQRVESIALASVRQPDLVLSAILHAVGIREAYDSALLDAIESALCGTETLLFLDNFEHLLDAAHDIVALLARCANVKILITSRAALRVRGEREVPVAPLSVPKLVSALDHSDSEGAHSCSSVAATSRIVAREQPVDYIPDTADMSVMAGGAVVRAPGTTGLVADFLGVPSVALFVQRVQATLPDFELNEHNIPIIAEICRQLDGLPLALELAAARVRLFAPSEILARLSNRLSVLAEHAPDLPSRQQTMREAITWSYSLLSAREQWVFRHLGVVANGCSAEAAEAICTQGNGDVPQVLDDLVTLAAHSLIHRFERSDGTSAIMMLETIREYALEQLEIHGERAAAERMHSSYFSARAEAQAADARAGYESFDGRVLDDDYANLQAALGWAIDHRDEAMGERLVAGLWRYWYARGMLTEGRRWVESLLDMVGDIDRCWMSGGPPRTAFEGPTGVDYQRSVERNHTEGADTRSVFLAAALNGAGMIAFRQGDHAMASAWLRRCLALYRWRGDKRWTAAVLNNLGIVAADQGLNAAAQRFHERSLAMKRELGNPHDIAVSLNNLGCVARARGRYAQAIAYFEENLTIQRALGDNYRIAHALGNLGTQAYVQGDYAQAYERYLECLALQERVGDRQGIALTKLNLGEVAKARGALGQAVTEGRDSLRMFRALGEPMRMISALSLLASASYAQGDSRSARVYVREILDLSRNLVSHRAVHQWVIVLARLAFDSGLHLDAVQLLMAAASQRDGRRAIWTPAERKDYDMCLEHLRTCVRAAAFQNARNAAKRWSWTELLRNARECLDRCGRLQHEEAGA